MGVSRWKIALNGKLGTVAYRSVLHFQFQALVQEVLLEDVPGRGLPGGDWVIGVVLEGQDHVDSPEAIPEKQAGIWGALSQIRILKAI